MSKRKPKPVSAATALSRIQKEMAQPRIAKSARKGVNRSNHFISARQSVSAPVHRKPA